MIGEIKNPNDNCLLFRADCSQTFNPFRPQYRPSRTLHRLSYWELLWHNEWSWHFPQDSPLSPSPHPSWCSRRLPFSGATAAPTHPQAAGTPWTARSQISPVVWRASEEMATGITRLFILWPVLPPGLRVIQPLKRSVDNPKLPKLVTSNSKASNFMYWLF